MFHLDALRVRMYSALRVDPDVQHCASRLGAHFDVREPHWAAAAMEAGENPHLRCHAAAAVLQRGDIEGVGDELVLLDAVHDPLARVQPVRGSMNK